MTLIFTIHEDALDCAVALAQAGRAYTFRRTIDGTYQIDTPE